MRPRQSSLGIALMIPGPSRCPVDCFNEAEAIKPRNRGSRQPCYDDGRRFNEAEAIKPRNLEVNRAVYTKVSWLQ